MSCEGYRDRLVDALAVGESPLDGDVSAHLRACAACKIFYEAQVNLFGAINSGVRAMVKEGGPASLLPGIRARMEEVPKGWNSLPISWAMPFAVVLLIAAGLGVFHRREGRPVGTADVSVMRWRPAEPSVTSTTPAKNKVVFATEHGQTRIKAPAKLETMPEVIVPAEEREAYERYVGGVPAGSGSPAQADKFLKPIEIASQEIAQLQIRMLEMGSLTGEAEE